MTQFDSCKASIYSRVPSQRLIRKQGKGCFVTLLGVGSRWHRHREVTTFKSMLFFVAQKVRCSSFCGGMFFSRRLMWEILGVWMVWRKLPSPRVLSLYLFQKSVRTLFSSWPCHGHRLGVCVKSEPPWLGWRVEFIAVQWFLQLSRTDIRRKTGYCLSPWCKMVSDHPRVKVSWVNANDRKSWYKHGIVQSGFSPAQRSNQLSLMDNSLCVVSCSHPPQGRNCRTQCFYRL